MNEQRTIAILGNGGAAAECALALRRNGFAGTIRMFSDNALPPFNPTLSTYFVAGKLQYDQLFPFGSDFYQACAVETVFDFPVVALDTANQTVVNAAGRQSRYDECLIATGATPVVPRIPGIEAPRVHLMRTLADAVRLKQALESRPRRAVVVGASMVGIKLVELFVDQQIPVCLADMAPQLFPQAAHPDCASVLEQRLEARGIRLRLGAALAGVEECGSGLRVHFADGEPPEECELLLLCIGVRPNLGFLDGSVKRGKGVLVDEYMRTSAAGVYAAGDVAEARTLTGCGSHIFGLWASARLQGRVAGSHMAGHAVSYPGDLVHNVTHFLGMTFVGIGDASGGDQVRKYAEGDNYAQFFLKRGRLIGANLIDSDVASGPALSAVIKSAIANGATSDQALRNLLQPSGRQLVAPWHAGRKESVSR